MRTKIALSFGVVFLLALLTWISMALWPRAVDPRTGPAIASVATADTAVVGLFAAIATAIAAWAAWRAARQSDETARHAVEALGMAIEPIVEATHQTGRYSDDKGGIRQAHEVVVWNPSRWVATDVEIINHPKFGKRQVFRLARLEPSPERAGSPPDMQEFPAEPVRLPELTHDLNWVDELVVRYSDERGLLRWEKNLSVARSRSADATSGEGLIQTTLPDGYGSPRRIDKR